VTQACHQSRQQGIHPGMPLAEADSLLDRGLPHLLLSDDPGGDRQSLSRLAVWCHRYTPWVAVESADPSADPAESLFLDITGCAHLWGGEESMLRAIIEDLASHHLQTRGVVADGWAGTWGLAHFSDQLRPASDSRTNHSEGWVVGPGLMEREVLRLPIEALRLPADKIDILHQLGLKRVEQIEAIPRSSLASRLGEDTLCRLDRLLGRAPESLMPIESTSAIDRHLCLEYPISQQQQLLQSMDPLLTEALSSLPTGHGICRLIVTLKLSDKEMPAVLSLGSCRPSSSIHHWREMTRLSLERSPLRQSAEEIHVHIPSSVPMEWREQEMFTSGEQRDTRAWELLLDRLSNRLGREKVVVAGWVPDAQPERSCSWAPAMTSTRTKRRSISDHSALCRPTQLRPTQLRPTQLRPTQLRPTQLFEHAIPIVVGTVVPADRPAWIQRGRARENLSTSWGPERIDTGWWRDGPMARDYFRVELMGGERLWIYRDLQTKRWFLHGVFD
jgi:protein ImuB